MLLQRERKNKCMNEIITEQILEIHPLSYQKIYAKIYISQYERWFQDMNDGFGLW